MAVKDIRFSAGYITITRDDGPPTEYPVKDILRALDIPVGLTYLQTPVVTTVANLVGLLIKELVKRDILDESFGEVDLEHIVQAIEEMGGDYDEPELSVN